MKQQISLFIKSVINSYAILFFSQNRVLGIILLLVSFFNPVSGFAGFVCVFFSLITGRLLKFPLDDLQTGTYSFNSLLLGIAFGAFYQVNGMFVTWLIFACIMVVITARILFQQLAKSGLPILSLPFILVFWLVLLAANSIFNTGLQQKNSYLLQEIYNGPGNLAGIEGYLTLHLPKMVSLFFRALSAVLFQHNILAGLLIGIGLLIHSRISFSLLILGFIAACGFNYFTHIYPEGISYYHLGANFMMTSVAVGSFFTIPSLRSYLLAILCIPVVFILVNSLTSLMAIHLLPVFSLPFCIANISLLYFLRLGKNSGKVQLATVQHYSPERNLYQFLNHQNRLNDLKYLKLNLPFMGFWTISQGYNGTLTHQTEWAQALDFVISDDEQNTYQYPGTLPEHFYCYNKPVLACADGVVEQIVNHVEDNPIGSVNLKENWGNTVVLRHAIGLYSKVSHLKKNSIKIKPGDAVKQGDMLGLCGNSGRSPEPHLHFQVQDTPYIGSKSMAYPFAYYFNRHQQTNSLQSYKTPTEGNVLSNPEINQYIKKVFDLQPGYTAKLVSEQGITEHWEVFKDALGQSYLYSKKNCAAAYFINNGTMFYFTSYYGSKHSLLYYFYMAAYKIVFSDADGIVADDQLPLQIMGNNPLMWLQDLAAPFYRFINISYQSSALIQKKGLTIGAKQYLEIAGKKSQTMEAVVNIDQGSLQAFSINTKGHHIKVQWDTENI